MKNEESLNMVVLLSDELKANYSGVSKKIDNEILAFEHNNINVQKEYIKKNSNLHRLIPFSGKFTWPDIARFSGIDIVYIRYGFSDCGFIRFLRNLKKECPSITVLLEIGTYPYISELKGLGVNPLVIFRDQFYSRFLHNYVDAIVTFRKYDQIFDTKVIYAINCANMDKITVPNRTAYRDDRTINLVAVSQIEYYYGFDRLIRGIADYYRNRSDAPAYNLLFHVVGRGAAVEELKQLSADLGVSDHVIFHGFKSGADLSEIYEIADVGIDCFGGHRKDDYLGFGTLKTREYLGKGLPFVTEYEVPNEVGSISDFILKVPADESDISADDIVAFFERIHQMPRLKVIEAMRGFAYSYCHVTVAMNSVIDFIREKHNLNINGSEDDK